MTFGQASPTVRLRQQDGFFANMQALVSKRWDGASPILKNQVWTGSKTLRGIWDEASRVPVLWGGEYVNQEA